MRSRASARRASPISAGWSCREPGPARARPDGRRRVRPRGVPGAAAARPCRAAALLAGVAGALLLPPAVRLAGAAVLLALVGWWWGGVRLDALDRSPLRSEVGRAGRALVEVTGEPRVGQFDQRQLGRALCRSKGDGSTSACSSSCRSGARLPRAPSSTCWRSCGCRAGRPTASTSAPGCAGKASMSSFGSTTGATPAAAGAGSAGRRPAALVAARRLCTRVGGRTARGPGRGGARRRQRALAGAQAGVPALGALPPARGQRCERRAARVRDARARVGGRIAASVGARLGAGGDRGVRARGRSATVRDPGGGLGRRDVDRVADGARARPVARAAARRRRAARLEPVHVRRRASSSRSPRWSRSSSPPARCCACSRGTRCTRGSPLRSPSRRRAASRRHRSSGSSSARCRCSGSSPTRSSSRCRPAARSGLRHRRDRPGGAAAGSRPGLAERLDRRLRRLLRPGGRGRPVRPGARPRRCSGSRRLPRGRRLCLAEMADDLKPAYLIAGSDRPKVDRTVARLARAVRRRRDRAAGRGRHDRRRRSRRLQRDGALRGEGTRLVVVEGVEAWKAPDAKAIADYLKAPAPGTTLALVGGELKKDAPLAKAVAAKGELLLWDVVMKAVARWIADQFKLQRRRRPSPRRAGCSPSSSATISTSSRARSTRSRRGRTAPR